MCSCYQVFNCDRTSIKHSLSFTLPACASSPALTGDGEEEALIKILEQPAVIATGVCVADGPCMTQSEWDVSLSIVD